MHALEKINLPEVNGQEPEPEHISVSDQQLVTRLNARIAETQGLQQFVLSHLAASYRLNQGDRIDDDGTIVRTTEPPPSA